MTSTQIETSLSQLFEQWAGERPSLVLPLAPSASPRIYYRLSSAEKTAIGAYNTDRKENAAFLAFSKHFKSKGLPVPEIYAEDLEQNVYLQEDLGATTLYSYLLQAGDYFPDYLVQIYKKVAEKLALLQVHGGEGLDFGMCYPREAFDKQSMLWDFNTFKYYFLKLAKIPFEEQALEEGMHRFADYLLGADCSHFMFRDFQARNIMVKGGEPYFIDYQGGRRGAMQYDLASLLFQAKANIPPDIRQELLSHYIGVVSELMPVDEQKFTEYFYGYALIRCIQTFGTYGFRGLFERKEYFIKSIPFAIRNAKWILENTKFPVEMPELTKALTAIVASKKFEPFDKIKASSSLLTVTVQSFSYQQGIPQDASGHGGGFVFDCRSMHNPGRYEPYKKLTGRDEAVINFLQQHSNMEDFLNYVCLIVNPAIENYIERSFTSLSISFGCTGGQHRSVYAADRLAKHIHENYGLKVVLKHVEQERKGWKN
ncbi:MAG: phosphotransferase enzyme family protein [Saprospiraceae bacterium]|nr:MAG: phosphotransferase enzyme family protein [Saprospiraceae bacterium]